MGIRGNCGPYQTSGGEEARGPSPSTWAGRRGRSPPALSGLVLSPGTVVGEDLPEPVFGRNDEMPQIEGKHILLPPLGRVQLLDPGRCRVLQDGAYEVRVVV